ncbi:MAG: peptidoglycan editing factor PgeF [Burkholderiales bacterium]|nr:peptidoglycan editing factor PgeF [Burkholderiales bacterium]
MPPDWIVPHWPAHHRVRAFITTRSGGASAGPYASFNLGDSTGDDPAAVRENKRRLHALLPAPPRWLRQVHGASVVRADEIDGAIDADASYTCQAGVVCAVKIADCMPVLLSRANGACVGIAHAGWRGLAAGVVERTVAALGGEPHAVLAYLGPAIGPAAFEVGDDVRAAFCDFDAAAAAAFRPLRTGKWLADLYALGRRRLHRSGVERVFGGGCCTYSEPVRFYSHRRNPVTGRMAAVIWLVEGAA